MQNLPGKLQNFPLIGVNIAKKPKLPATGPEPQTLCLSYGRNASLTTKLMRPGSSV